MGRGAQQGAERLDWVDSARGICIILVVMMHFHGVYFDHLSASDLSKKISDAVVSAARPARMPTFFFISGYLASRALNRSWRDAFDGRIALIYWVYLVWSIISTFTLFALFEPATTENALRFIRKIAVQLVFARQPTWFLYGLVVFFIAAKLLIRLPRVFVGAALVASAFSEHIPDMVASEMVRTMPYFLLGIYFPSLFLKAAGEPSIKRCVVLFAIYSCAVVPVLFHRTVPGIWIPPTIVGIALLLSIARLLPASRPVDWLRYVGRNTLPIYVMHIPLLLIARETTQAHLNFAFPQDLGFSVVGNLAVIALCLTSAFALRRAGQDWLFSLPSRLAIKRVDNMLSDSPANSHGETTRVRAESS